MESTRSSQFLRRLLEFHEEVQFVVHLLCKIYFSDHIFIIRFFFKNVFIVQNIKIFQFFFARIILFVERYIQFVYFFDDFIVAEVFGEAPNLQSEICRSEVGIVDCVDDDVRLVAPVERAELVDEAGDQVENDGHVELVVHGLP